MMSDQSFSFYLKGYSRADASAKACFNCRYSKICKVWGNSKLMKEFESLLSAISKVLSSDVIDLQQRFVVEFGKYLAENCDYYSGGADNVGSDN